MSSAATLVQPPQWPAGFLTRSCTTTSVTAPWAQVTPTEENFLVEGWETVSAGTPGSSFPELATSASEGEPLDVDPDVGSEADGPAGAAGVEVGAGVAGSIPDPVSVAAAPWGSPSVVTTASPFGASTDPRA